jgi:peroxiredoxin
VHGILVGSRVPSVTFGYLKDGEVRSIGANEVFAYHRTIVIGVPGAFTPSSTAHYIPDFIRSAVKLRASGFSQLVCVAPNDPFVLAEWAHRLDPNQTLLFLSDGNLDFTRALGLQTIDHSQFLGCRSEHYLMTVENGTIMHLRVKPNVLTFSGDHALDAKEVVLV